MKEKLVAIKYDELGKCEQVAIVKNVQDNQYKTLKNEENEHKEFELNKEQELNKKVNENKEKITKLEYIIAKNLYDSFVDRGLLEYDDEFNKMFYNMVVSGSEFDITKLPSDYEKILNYVRGI